MPAFGRARVGRRGRVLLFFGALDVVYSVSLAAPSDSARRLPFFQWLVDVAPLWVWSAVWGVAGVLCLWQAFRRRDAIGYAAAYSVKAFWGLVSFGAWVTGHLDRGYVAAGIWLGLAYMVWVISGWPEAGDTRGPTWIPRSS